MKAHNDVMRTPLSVKYNFLPLSRILNKNSKERMTKTVAIPQIKIHNFSGMHDKNQSVINNTIDKIVLTTVPAIASARSVMTVLI